MFFRSLYIAKVLSWKQYKASQTCQTTTPVKSVPATNTTIELTAKASSSAEKVVNPEPAPEGSTDTTGPPKTNDSATAPTTVSASEGTSITTTTATLTTATTAVVATATTTTATVPAEATVGVDTTDNTPSASGVSATDGGGGGVEESEKKSPLDGLDSETILCMEVNLYLDHLFHRDDIKLFGITIKFNSQFFLKIIVWQRLTNEQNKKI